MSTERFARVFRNEHRQVRDVLLDLIAAFEARELASVRALLDRAAVLTGPHFRYEEESLYPALAEIFGEGYIEKLLGDHDRAIGTAKKLVGLSKKQSLTEDDVGTACRLVREVLPHVSDCDGLSIMVERVDATTVREILDTRDRAREAGLNLLEWADQVRGRPPVVPD